MAHCVRHRLLGHFEALALPSTIHPGLRLFLNEFLGDWFGSLQWVWDHLAMTCRTYYRDVKHLAIERWENIEEID